MPGIGETSGGMAPSFLAAQTQPCGSTPILPVGAVALLGGPGACGRADHRHLSPAPGRRASQRPRISTLDRVFRVASGVMPSWLAVPPPKPSHLEGKSPRPVTKPCKPSSRWTILAAWRRRMSRKARESQGGRGRSLADARRLIKPRRHAGRSPHPPLQHSARDAAALTDAPGLLTTNGAQPRACISFDLHHPWFDGAPTSPPAPLLSSLKRRPTISS